MLTVLAATSKLETVRDDETQSKTMPEINRTIVNRGILRLPLEAREVESFSLYCQIERKDLNASLNVKRPRPASFYGYAQGLELGYVVWEKPLTFENEELFVWREPRVNVLQAIQCATKAIRDDIGLVMAASGFPPIPRTPDVVLADRMPMDAIVFKLFGKTTLYIRAIWRPAPELCGIEYTWQERETPVAPLGGTNQPFPPPNIPVNIVDPNGYDLADPPYTAPDDYGDTYAPDRPNCTGCSLTLVWSNPGGPRFPGGPAAPNPSLVINYAAEQCPIDIEVLPDDGAASFPKAGDYVVRDRFGTILDTFTSYTFNPFSANVDNGECF